MPVPRTRWQLSPEDEAKRLTLMVKATTFAQIVIMIVFFIGAAAWAPERYAWPRWGLLLGLLGLGMTVRIAQRRMLEPRNPSRGRPFS